MAGNPFFSGRIPKELHEQIIKHCEETGKTKTDVLIAALSNYLNIPITETNDKTDRQVSKELADLRERMQKLEDTIYQTSVITNDNKKDKGVIVTVVPQSNDLIITTDNRHDNKSKSDEISTKRNDKQLEKKPTKNSDNRHDNNGNHNQLDFTDLENKDVIKKTGISSTQIGRLKDKIFDEAKSQGYNIQPNIKFSPAIEAIQKRKEIIIEDIKYKLFCIGLDDKTKPIWMLRPDDNISYQPDILKTTHLKINTI
ncbi:MAG: hypothetical protein AAGA02_14560 [Bacteroidota bacterium]